VTKFVLQRTMHTPDGIFGRLILGGETFCQTLEHAFLHDKVYLPILPDGAYTLKRGIHRLTTGPEFVTYAFPRFMSWDKKPHTGVLFHVGNWNQDSTGCVLVGEEKGSLGGKPGVLRSKMAFKRFLEACGDAETINVDVI